MQTEYFSAPNTPIKGELVISLTFNIVKLREKLAGRESNTMKILIVEDDNFVRPVLKKLLSKLGHKVITAVDGEDGLVRLSTNKVDLLLLDLYMPNMSGKEMLFEMERRDYLMPDKVVVMSGFFKELSSLPGWITGSLQKPFTQEAFENAVG